MQFGVCPRSLCRGTPTLPVGIAEYLHVDTVKVYCPLCEDIYDTPSHIQSPPHVSSSKLDGAYFGPSFAHLLLLGRTLIIHNERNSEHYIPRIFGFRVRNQRGRKPLIESMVGEAYTEDNSALNSSNANASNTTASNNTNDNNTMVQDHANSLSTTTTLITTTAAMITTTTTTTLASKPQAVTLASLGLSYPNADGNILDPLIKQIRRGVPLTSPWQDGKRPEADDFNDDDDETQTGSSSKRRKRHNGAGE